MSNTIICTCVEKEDEAIEKIIDKNISSMFMDLLFFLRCVCENCVYANCRQNKRARIVPFEWKGWCLKMNR